MIRIMIIKVLQKEKEMRARMLGKRHFVAGYDEAKFVKTEGNIKAPEFFKDLPEDSNFNLRQQGTTGL